MNLILLLLSLFSIPASAQSKCDRFVGLKSFLPTHLEDRSKLSAINEYLNMTQASDRHLPKKIVEKKNGSVLAMKFKNPAGKRITLVLLESGHIVSIIEEDKVLYCDDDPKKKSAD